MWLIWLITPFICWLGPDGCRMPALYVHVWTCVCVLYMCVFVQKILRGIALSVIVHAYQAEHRGYTYCICLRAKVDVLLWLIYQFSVWMCTWMCACVYGCACAFVSVSVGVCLGCEVEEKCTCMCACISKCTCSDLSCPIYPGLRNDQGYLPTLNK